jgi:hypothetical protein
LTAEIRKDFNARRRAQRYVEEYKRNGVVAAGNYLIANVPVEEREELKPHVLKLLQP